MMNNSSILHRHAFPMKTHLDGSKSGGLAITGAKADAGANLVPAASRDDDAGIPRSLMPEGVTIACYENTIPPFVESALEQRYASLFSSLAAMRAYGNLSNASVFLATRGSEIVMLWLFRRHGKTVRVLNEAIPVSEAEAACFAHHVFGCFLEVQYIVFNAVDTGIRSLAWPMQRQNCSEDSVLALPPRFDDYLAALGKATRKNLKRYSAKLKERFPSFSCNVAVQDRIDERQLREVIRLNRLRMDHKGKPQGITPDNENAILDIARCHGMLLTATIDERICAGAILFKLRDNYFSFVRAHDPAYDEYRLGLVGACHMVAECIARGGKELHFMWGREQHKSMLLGVERRLDRLTIYRSAWHLLLNPQVALKNAFLGASRQCKLWLLDKMNRDDDIIAVAAGSARRVIRRLRALRA